MARVLGSEARHTARGGLLVPVLRSSVSVLLLKASPPYPWVLAEPSACALNGVQSGRSVAPRLGRKDTLLMHQSIRAPHSGRLFSFLFLLCCPSCPKEAPSSICPLWVHLTVLWLQGKEESGWRRRRQDTIKGNCEIRRGTDLLYSEEGEVSLGLPELSPNFSCTAQDSLQPSLSLI